jgi:hypothetical protein
LALTGGRIVDKLKLMLTQLIEKIMPRLLFWVAVILWISTITPIFAVALSVNTLDFFGWFILFVYFVIIPLCFLLLCYRLINDIEKQKKELTDEYLKLAFFAWVYLWADTLKAIFTPIWDGLITFKEFIEDNGVFAPVLLVFMLFCPFLVIPIVWYGMKRNKNKKAIRAFIRDVEKRRGKK